MFNNIFRRFDKTVEFHSFSYTQESNVRDNEFDMQTISMDRIGFNIHTTVRNFMAETVMLGGSLSVAPTKIRSLVRNDRRQTDDLRNYVVIVIYSSEVEPDIAPNKRARVRKTEIRIPGRMLHQGSVFIDELDCYLTTESNIDATRALLEEDILGNRFDQINVPPSMIKNDPETIYADYKELVNYCIKRRDKITIRIGYDIRYGVIPNIIKTMRVAILDSYFIPFDDYKLEYDPSLDEDEFVLENLHLSSSGNFRFTFTELKRLGSVYLDHNERDTLFGSFYGVALFADETTYANYVFKRKTNERFKDETLFLAERSGDPRLKEEIDRLERVLEQTNISLSESTGENAELTAKVKRLRADLKDREESLAKITKHHDAKMSADVILSGLDVEHRRLDVDNRKIDHEQDELGYRQESSKMAHKANMLKNIGDIMKSGWGITTAILGGILSVVALCKKYNVKLTMGSK